jgi:hypothetical protein
LEPPGIFRDVLDGGFEGLKTDAADAAPLKESGVGLQDKDSLEVCFHRVPCLEICWIGDGLVLVLLPIV